ncbi:hypothetical protein [Photobacterium gaetbulicola]|nr:hypothetical protein [Photobacterium gaetbulicola]
MSKQSITYLLLLVSGIYLTLETSFFLSLMNAIRVDGVHTIEDIELYGRSLSGVGMSILAFKQYAMGEKAREKWKICLLLVCTFCGTYYGQKLVVDTYIDSRGEAEQARHYRAYMIQKSYSNNIRFLKNQSMGDKTTDVQIALLAPIAINQARQFNDQARLKTDYWLPIYQSEFKSNLAFYYDHYRKVSGAINSVLERYRKAARNAEKPLQDKGAAEYRKVVSNYNRYIRRLGHEKITQRIKDEIYKKSGIRMSTNWHPTKGRREFTQKYMAQFSSEIATEKQRKLQSLYGVKVALKHLDSPLNSPAVIKAINEKIDIFSSQKPLRLNLTKESFYRHFKDVVPNNLKEKYSIGYSQRDPELMEKAGRIFIVPFVALFFSALCIVLNTRSFVASLIKVFCFGNVNSKAFKWVNAGLWLAVVFAPLAFAKTMFVDTAYISKQLEALPVWQQVALTYTGSASVAINSIVGDTYIPLF